MKFDIKQVVSISVAMVANEFFGGYTPAMAILTNVMLLDLGSGLLKGFYNKDLNSKVGFRGLTKKFIMLIMVSLSVQLDKLYNSGDKITNMMLYYLIAIEALSIFENASIFLPIPEDWTQYLEQVKNGKEVK